MADFNPSVLGTIPKGPASTTQEAPNFRIGGTPLVPTGAAPTAKPQAALFGVPGGNLVGAQGASQNAPRAPLGETGFRAAMNGAPLPGGQSLPDKIDGWFVGLQASTPST
jgi:hypothetical protein